MFRVRCCLVSCHFFDFDVSDKALKQSNTKSPSSTNEVEVVETEKFSIFDIVVPGNKLSIKARYTSHHQWGKIRNTTQFDFICLHINSVKWKAIKTIITQFEIHFSPFTTTSFQPLEFYFAKCNIKHKRIFWRVKLCFIQSSLPVQNVISAWALCSRKLCYYYCIEQLLSG